MLPIAPSLINAIDRLPNSGRAATPPRLSDAELTALLKTMDKKRSKLWEMPSMFHCSIVGTCLTMAELRKVVEKVVGHAVDGLSDHALHNEGVRLAGNEGFAGKLLQKALDRRHQLTLKRFDKARNAEDVGRMWEEAKKAGDIPGAYWAALTHPAATDVLVDAVFCDVHMLSHLVGAANRADIRRLAALEAENAELERKVRKQQAQLAAAIVSRDATIRQLNDMLGHKILRVPGC